MGGVLAKAFGCGIAGVVAWILCEPFFPKAIGASLGPAWGAVELVFIFLLGAFIGLVAGFVHGVRQGGRTNLLISSALGLIFGAMGAGFGHTIASLVFSMMGGALNSPTTMVARTFAFIPLGLLIGAAVGASQRSVRSLVSGAIGGAIAGFVTGAAFDPLSTMLSSFSFFARAQSAAAGTQIEIGAPGRAAMALGLGLFIGLFTSIVDLATRRAWVRLVVGRNEGKEWPIDAQQTLIGRDERAHVPVFADPNVPALAAVIAREGGQYVLRDPGSPIGVGHNGVRVGQAVLTNGDTFQVGNLNFQFMMKAGAASAHEGRHPGISNSAPSTAPYNQQPAVQQMSPQLNQTTAYNPTQAVQAAPQQAQTSPALVVTSGPMTGQRISLVSPVEIGREGQGLSLATDSQASRKHALATPTPGGVQVTDLGSTNGTYVNGQRVQTAVVRPGDVLTIGSTTFRIE